MYIKEGGIRMLPINIYPYIDYNNLNLDWIIKHFKEFVDSIKALEGYAEKHEAEIAELIEFERALASGNFPPEMEKALIKWCEENTTEIIAAAIPAVFFEIDDEGYFIANIPESWNVITFGTTGLDDFVPGFGYGHLTLTY